MKSILILISCIQLQVLNSQNSCLAPPTPPDKVCYNYDRAGNRIAENQAWIDVMDPTKFCPDCTPNNPDNTYSNFGGLGKYYYPLLNEEYIIGIQYTSWKDNGFVLCPFCIDPYNQTNPQEKLNGEKLYDFELKIVPNPSVGQFQVVQKGFDAEKATILIIDNKGTVVFDRKYVDGYVNISEFSDGSYLLILKDNQKQSTVRLNKLR